MAEIAAGAVDAPVAVGVIVDAAGAAEGRVAADGIVADAAAGPGAEDTKIIAADLH
jgi:hypothetical protein